MRNIQNISKLLVIISIFIFACSPRVHQPAIDQDRRTGDEHRFNPMGFPGDDAVITGQHRELSQSDKPDTTASEARPPEYSDSGRHEDHTVVQEQPLVVFRVQVFASKSFDEAHQFADDIEGMFPEGVFVEYHVPYYKVRVGEFYTPEDGESFLDKVKRYGFKNAWLVRVVQ